MTVCQMALHRLSQILGQNIAHTASLALNGSAEEIVVVGGDQVDSQVLLVVVMESATNGWADIALVSRRNLKKYVGKS